MNILPHTLSLIVTHKCTAACDHCCFGCHPKESLSIPPDRIAMYIDQAREIHSYKAVVFTGGECFLLGKHLDVLVKQASDYGYLTRFVSNGYWATSMDVAGKRLDSLVKNGLNEANFSTGDAHAEWVNPEYVRNGAIAAAERGLMTCIMVETFKESKFDFEKFIDHPELRKWLEVGMVIIKCSPWMTFGGQNELSYSSKYVQRQQAHNMGCNTVLRVTAITPSENLVACCGLTLEQIPELHLGSLKEQTIKQIISNNQDDLLKIWIHLDGPMAVLRYVQSKVPGFMLPSDKAHICDQCRYLYGSADVRRVLSEGLPPQAKNIMERYKYSLLMPQSEDAPKNGVRMLKSTYGIDHARRELCSVRD